LNETSTAAPRAHAGRAVMLTEMVLEAKSGHPTCNGRGYVSHLAKGQQEYRPCSCSFTRFMKAHRAHVYDNPETGTLFWHPAHAPASMSPAAAQPEEQPVT
jgi:hypothetical protein